MKRILAGLAFASTLAACSADSVTGPSKIAASDSSVSLIRISASTIQYSLAAIGSSDREIDTTAGFSLGQTFFPYSGYEYSYAITNGQKVNVVLEITSGTSLYTDGGSSATYQFLTDWQPVEQEKHRGIKLDVGMRVIFQDESFLSGLDGQIVSFDGTTHYTSQVVGSVGAVSYTASSEKPATHFINPTQVYTISGCTKSDSLVFRTFDGVGFAQHDSMYGETVNTDSQVQQAVVHCAFYPNATMARTALASERAQIATNAIKSYSLPMRPVYSTHGGHLMMTFR